MSSHHFSFVTLAFFFSLLLVPMRLFEDCPMSSHHFFFMLAFSLCTLSQSSGVMTAT